MLEAFLNIETKRVIPTFTEVVFLNARVSHVNVNTMKGNFEKRSEL